MEATAISTVIAYGENRYRKNLQSGRWVTLAFGFPIGRVGTPIWHWITIPTDKVPKEVREFEVER